MAINKSAEFSAELVQLATLAKALSHPARIAILQTLAPIRTPDTWAIRNQVFKFGFNFNLH